MLRNQREIDISPNFTTESSRLAEDRMLELIERAKEIGVEVFSIERDHEMILDLVKEKAPGRFDLVMEKLQEEGITLDQLSQQVVLDRMLGVDALFRFDGKVYAVDVTTGKHSVVINKERKFHEMEDIYRELGIDHALILRLKEDISEDLILNLFSKIEIFTQEGGAFSAIVKYPETPMKKRKGRL